MSVSVLPVQGPVARHVPPAPPSADVVAAGAAVVGPGGAALLEGGAGPLVVVAVLLPLLPSPVPNHSSNPPIYLSFSFSNFRPIMAMSAHALNVSTAPQAPLQVPQSRPFLQVSVVT